MGKIYQVERRQKEVIKREPSDEDADNHDLSFYKVKNSISNPTTSIKPGDNDVRIMQSIESMTADEIRKEKFHIWKNIIVISMSFMFLFTAFNSMGNLQSSINSEAGLGTGSLSTIYGALVISCMFVPTWLIKVLKCKWTIVVCQFCYSAYIAAQFYPTFYTLIPAAIILGFGAAPMWSAKCTYLTQVGNRYAVLTGERSSASSITRFFGVFFMFFQTSQIWGNLISSLVLSTFNVNSTTINPSSSSKPPIEELFCGAAFCPTPAPSAGNNSDSGAINGPKEVDYRIWLLAGILLGFALIASLILIFFVDPLSRFGEAERQGSSSGLSGWKLFVATFQQMKNPYQIILIPLTLWCGFEQAFLTADFTEAFITCPWGVEHVGYVLICYGATDAVASVTCGSIVRRTGRVPLFIFATALNLALIIAMLIWIPDASEPAALFIMAALWGLADAVWQTQVNAFYGIIFASNEEAAFSNHRLWESIGFIIAYAYGSFICVNAKLYVLLGVLVTGMIGYLFIEFKEMKKNKSQIEKDTIVNK